MKHGIYYAYWETEWAADYLPYVEKVARLGFDILELGGSPLPSYTPEQLRRLRDSAKSHGVELTVGYGPRPEHDVGNPEVREKALEWYRRLFAAMEQLDSTVIGGALYSHWPVDYSVPVNKSEDWKHAIDGVRALAAVAAEYGVQLNLESLNRFENYLINTAEECVSFVRQTACPNVHVMLDTFHMNIEETSIRAAILTAGDLLGHFHTGECNRLPPGQGRMPWREIGEALREIHYNGTVVMEPFVRMGGQVGQDIRIWRPLNSGDTRQLDRDAAQALCFQRYMLEG